MNRLLLILSILLLGLPLKLTAQDNLPEPMRPYRLVNDFADVFSVSEKAQLEEKLRAYHDQTTNQIYVVTVHSLNGDAPYNYAAQLSNKWKIGQKGKDNGVLILIKPKTKDERGDVFIAPGYGLEDRLNDAFCGRVIDNQMIPHLVDNNYYTATSSAINAITERIADKSNNKETDSITNRDEHITADDVNPLVKYILLPLVIILFIVSPRFRRFMFYMLLMLMRGGGGNGGGRGFGGGGGGRSGGGGAGRSW